jgi:Dehydratase family
VCLFSASTFIPSGRTLAATVRPMSPYPTMPTVFPSAIVTSKASQLHVSPESFVGGLLALLKQDDIIDLDVPARQLNMPVSEDELARRRAAWLPKQGIYPRDCAKLFMEHIKQADEGCDLDFLEGTAPSLQ